MRWGGNKVGSRHKVTRAVGALLEGEHEALTRKAIDKALEGDGVALRLCLDRIAPPRKDAPISFSLPSIRTAGDTVTASSARRPRLRGAKAAGLRNRWRGDEADLVRLTYTLCRSEACAQSCSHPHVDSTAGIR
jgi:hypothetical protein